jgi:predicted DNA-binding protein with PD1-like motif
LRTRLLHESGGLRTFVVIFDKGDEALGGLTDFAREEDLTGASLTAVGAFSRATLAYFDPELMDYVDISVDNQAEVLSMIGDVALADGGPEVHAHVVVGHRDGSTSGGHLRKADVFPTLEVVITETPAHLSKRHDPRTGLTLIDPEK